MSTARARIAPRVVEVEDAPRHKTAQALALAAADLFAEQGFHATTRDIAARLGVTQALIYKYFAGKNALIDAALEAGLTSRWENSWDDILADAAMPLGDRLKRFYAAYLDGMSVDRSRLWMYATLAGIDLPKRYAFPLTERVLKPIVTALRAEAGLRGFEARPMTRGERELAMSLHGAMMFLAQRKNLYRIPLPASLGELIAMQVDVFLGGALDAVRHLGSDAASESMKVPLLR